MRLPSKAEGQGEEGSFRLERGKVSTVKEGGGGFHTVSQAPQLSCQEGERPPPSSLRGQTCCEPTLSC